MAVAGVPSQPNVYYSGGVGGGVWKTTDGGDIWAQRLRRLLQDRSVGAIAVAESDPNVIYAGMGEACVRGNVSHGDGVYKSRRRRQDLDERRPAGHATTSARSASIPKNPDIVYVAALGHLWGPNRERGVYRSTDGGATWKQVLYARADAGAVDLAMDPPTRASSTPASGRCSRKPWHFDSGGPGSGLFKIDRRRRHLDRDLARRRACREGVLGKIGVAVSPAKPERVWALVEAEDGGVFRSDDGGRTWKRVNEQSNLRQRAWYYSHIFADPQNADTVYALNVGMYRKSIDGGRTFSQMHAAARRQSRPVDRARQSAAHDRGQRRRRDRHHRRRAHLVARIYNQPTAQFYHVALDNDFPYRVYGAQQDNTHRAHRQPHRAARITRARLVRRRRRRERLDRARSAQSARSSTPGSYDGLHHALRPPHRAERAISTPGPRTPMGYGAEAMKYRFQWTFPIVFSPHDPKTLYIGGNIAAAARPTRGRAGR